MNNQQLVKIINFYRINHQFHQPYRFLLDGNFIKLLVEKDLDLKKKFDQVVKAKCSLRVTSCIIRELQLLGDQFKLVVAAAKQLKTVYCKHPLQYSVDRCLMEQIGPNNEKQYIVCSQDLELRRQVRAVGNVPIMYFGPDQRVTMEDIHKKTLEQLKIQQKEKYMLKQEQLKEIQELRKKQAQIDKKMKIKHLSAVQGIQIKTKVVKGPNPLSVKKKQPRHSSSTQQQNPTEPKRKRIRKRNKNSKVEGAAQ